MSNTVRAYAAQTAQTPLGPFSLPRRDLRDDDVSLDILYCGVCHSDLHQAKDDFGNTHYPCVPGHEIIGRIASVGPAVSRFKPGDLAGVGCMVDSCGQCEPCATGEEQYCVEQPTMTYNGVDRHDGAPTYGGYSERIVTREKFVLRIPEELDPTCAGPLLCAGITMYSPLRFWKAGTGKKVAIVGLGGLGHIGLKFAKAMGAETTLITRSADKAEEALSLGADHALLSRDRTQMRSAMRQFDLIVDTVPVEHDLAPYLMTVDLNGVYVLVGLIGPVQPAVHSGILMFGRRSIAGSMLGGLEETQEMLDFCGKHGIGCNVELIAIQDINKAYQRLQRSDVKYRFVIDMKSLKSD